MPNMAPLQVTLRVRMGSHDAHYSGGLVDGARILALLGDVATELLIRTDGDEGLLRAYESVEFLAPVFAGDFIEATGVLTGVGETSRKIAFQARKVAGSLRDPDLPASAAQAYAEPVLVCRAVATCVVPKQLQRRPRLLMPGLPAAPSNASLTEGTVFIPPPPHEIITPPSATPVEAIITAAIVGAEVGREKTPYLPLTPEEIAEEARRCREAGAAIVHLHVRRPDGSPTQSSRAFAEAIEAIRAATDVVIQVSTGGALGMGLEERSGPLACKPEMATLNCGSTNFGDGVFANSRPEIREMTERLRQAGSAIELECYEIGHIDEALSLAAEGLIPEPLHFQFVLGVPGAAGGRESVLRFMASQIPSGSTWSVAAVGPWQQPMTEAALRLGGHARVGLEDNIYLSKGVLAEGSAPLVSRAVAYAHEIGRKVVEPARARELLRLTRA